MSKLTLYGTDGSPPVRACLLTLKALNIEFEYKIVNLLSGEHLSEEFSKHNPQHTVPVLNDGADWIWDSHAICSYLVDKYAKDDSLYPKDLVKRAHVNQRMYFDASVLFMAMRAVTVPMLRKKTTVVMREKTENIIGGYQFVETFLGDNPYLTGDTMTIADFCCLATITSLRGIVDISPVKYPKITEWLERMQQLPYYEEANGKGAAMIVGLMKSILTEVII